MPEVVRERSSLVVRAARWFAHNMLFRCGAILSAPYVDQGLIGTHVEVIGDAFQACETWGVRHFGVAAFPAR